MSERHRRSHFAPESRLCGRADHALPGAPEGVAARPVSVRPGAAPRGRAFERRDPYVFRTRLVHGSSGGESGGGWQAAGHRTGNASG
jgi:hypothetical protein